MPKKIAIYSGDGSHNDDPRFRSMVARLEAASFLVSDLPEGEAVPQDTEMVLSIGGDGTFLSAARRVGSSGVPILGVNLGRLGFLSEYSPEEASDALVSGEYSLEKRSLLHTVLHYGNDGQAAQGQQRQRAGQPLNGGSVPGQFIVPRPLGDDALALEGDELCPYALNEVTVHRSGAAILGVDVEIDGNSLPTYWADGLLVATSSGSTAYSLSVGGPICSPEAKVLIIAPIAPHNLNARPLVVPDTTRISISLRSRDPKVMLSMDNRNHLVSREAVLKVQVAQFSLNRVCLKSSSFIKALTTKLFWGEDFRNGAHSQGLL